MRESSDKHINFLGLLLFVGTTLFVALATFPAWSELPEEKLYFSIVALSAYSTALYVFWIFRQQTVYTYSIFAEHCVCESFLDYPCWAEGFFKGLVFVACLFFIGIAVFTASLFPVIGVSALVFIYAGRLLGWKNEVHHKESLPWEDHNYVTIDRKRKIVVVHYTCLSNGFEVRFPDHELLERFLCFLRQTLPSTAEFLERHWDPYDYRNG
jgi:hypothetical protein